MSLEKYAEKRDFTKTAEPKAGRSRDKLYWKWKCHCRQ